MKGKMLITKRNSLKKDGIYSVRERGDDKKYWVQDLKGDEWLVCKRHVEIIEL